MINIIWNNFLPPWRPRCLSLPELNIVFRSFCCIFLAQPTETLRDSTSSIHCRNCIAMHCRLYLQPEQTSQHKAAPRRRTRHRHSDAPGSKPWHGPKLFHKYPRLQTSREIAKRNLRWYTQPVHQFPGSIIHRSCVCKGYSYGDKETCLHHFIFETLWRCPDVFIIDLINRHHYKLVAGTGI